MGSTVNHYWEHHQVIKAIEKSSLQATFGEGITSTKDLLPKNSNLPSNIPVKASSEDAIVPVHKHTNSNRNRLLSVRARINAGLSLLARKKKHGNTAPDLTPKDNSKDGISTNRPGKIPSGFFTNGDNMPAISTYENSGMPFSQRDSLEQIPIKTKDEKVEELRQWTGTQRVNRNTEDYSKVKHPNHDRVWDSKNLFCVGCAKNTMKRCQKCGANCCFWSMCKDTADGPGTLPQERVKASQWLKKIAGLMSDGLDEPTFMACTRCRRVLCPECTNTCDTCNHHACSDCCSRCPICQVPKCIPCKFALGQACWYHGEISMA